MIYNSLGTLRNDKVLPAGYSSISHLPGSKMIDDRDTLLGQQETEWLTVRRKDPKDLVIITEKVDGMNAEVYRGGNSLFPILRKGYDVRINPNDWIKSFAAFVEDNALRFFELLRDCERICGEWMIKTHTLEYKLKSEPYIVYDLIRDTKRERYVDFIKRVTDNRCNFTPAGLIHIGEAMDPQTALRIAGEGYHGVIGGQPEGVVYKYESWKNGYVCSGKYVSHPHVGKEEFFRVTDMTAWNEVKKRYKIYIPKIEEVADETQ